MHRPSSSRAFWFEIAPILSALFVGCAFFTQHPKGQIVVQVVSWPRVKQLAEPDAGLAGQTVTVQRAEDHHLVAEKTTDASGILVFNVSAGSYIVGGLGDQAEVINVEPGRSVSLKLVQH